MRWSRLLTRSSVALMVLSGCSKGEAERLALAKAYLGKEETQAAIIELKGVLQDKPDSGEARLLLGTALLESGDGAGAEVELRRALENEVSEEQVAPVLAQALLKTRQYATLIKQYERSQFKDSAATAAMQTALATAYAAQGDPTTAQAAIAKAQAAAPQSTPALIVQARLKAGAGDVDGALSALDSLLARDANSAEAWQLKGELLQNAKADSNGAVLAYQKSLAIRPDQAAVHGALITLHFLRQDEKAASAQAEALKKALPGNPLTRLFDAQSTFARGDYRHASKQFNELLSAVPDNVMLLYLAGAAELQIDALAQAESHLLRAVQLQPQFAGARRVLARVYLRARQPAKAVAALKSLLDKTGIDAETLTLAAQAQLLAGEPAAANDLFMRAAAMKPKDAKNRTALAVGQLAVGHTDAALGELQAISAADRGVSADLALISARLQRKEFDAALKVIEVLEKKQPGSPVAAGLRGRAHLLRKDFPSARSSFEKALALDARYLPAVDGLAALDLAEKKPDAARGRFEALLKADPKNVQAYLRLAELKRMANGTRAQVEELLASAVAADPTDLQARFALIDHHAAGGDSQSALTAAQAAAAALPASLEVQDKLARLQLAAGDTNSARATFGRMAAQHGGSVLGHQGLAEGYVAAKDFAAAWRSAQRALELEPNSLAAQRVAIFAAMGLKRPQDALTIARQVQAQRPKEALGFILEGEIEASQIRWDAAAAAFRKGTSQTNPLQAPARLHFALVQGKKTADAARFADSWLSQRPKDTLFLLYLGEQASRQGDLALAERRYQQVLAQQPGDILALNNLASLLIKQKKPGAVAMAERAVKAAPNRPALLDTLASALASEGQIDKAIVAQKDAVALATGAPIFRLNLARLYAQAGNKAAARVELEALRQSGKGFPEQVEVEALLKSLDKS